MIAAAQPELFDPQPSQERVEWLVAFLKGLDWISAADILRENGQEATDNNKRKIRLLADHSGGRICGHQKGYKLANAMTASEYQHWRNEWLKSALAIKARVIESDIVFYGKTQPHINQIFVAAPRESAADQEDYAI